MLQPQIVQILKSLFAFLKIKKKIFIVAPSETEHLIEMFVLFSLHKL